uniref:Uncharacterized protein n=1 Tax=Anguilla anguilla TaxID=7936 RepID=A0A0E9P524_ANGAN
MSLYIHALTFDCHPSLMCSESLVWPNSAWLKQLDWFPLAAFVTSFPDSSLRK